MKTTNAFAVALLALVATGALLPASAEAQWRRHPGVARRDWSVRPLVDAGERQSNAFRAYFESHDASGRLGRFHDNKWLKRKVQKMDEAFERLREKADDHRPGIGKGQLVDALNYARDIDREIYSAPDTPRTIREWNDLRGTLNSLADLYGVRGL